MKTMRKNTAYVLMVFLALTTSGLQGTTKVGTSAAQFLKIGVGARAAAMGGSFNALASDVTSIYWNPAGLARQQGSELFFSHTSWLAGISHEFFCSRSQCTRSERHRRSFLPIVFPYRRTKCVQSFNLKGLVSSSMPVI